MAGWGAGAVPTPPRPNPISQFTQQRQAYNASRQAPSLPRTGGSIAPMQAAPAPVHQNAYTSALPSWASGSSAGNNNSDPLNLAGIQRIMQQSGSTDPSDPYNWAAIARSLQGAQAAAPVSSGAAPGGGYSGGSGSSYSAPAPAAAPVPSVFQAPTAVTTPTVQVPTSVTKTAEGTAGAPTGMSFQSTGGGTFGSFERRRNAKTPKQGLSVTPELLRRQAQARLG